MINLFGGLLKMKKIIFCLLIALCFIIPVSANGEIPIINSTTETTIQWNWNNTYAPVGVTQLSIDGYVVWNYDAYANEFILSDLEPNTSHTIIIYSGENVSINTAITKPMIVTKQESFFDTLNMYLIFFLALVCLVFGVGIPLLGFGAVLFGFIGMATSVNNSFIMGILFLIVICAGFIEGFNI